MRDIDPIAHRLVAWDSAVTVGMAIPDPNHAVNDVAANSGAGAAGLGAALPPAEASPISAKTKEHRIRVSPDILSESMV